MTTRDIALFARENWEQHRESITEVSSNLRGESLVQSDEMIYNFDKICKDLYNSASLPTSADGLVVNGRNIEIVEFKSGFKDRITKDNFDVNKAKCAYSDEICPDYWREFRKNRLFEKSELISNIQLKAIESFITLDRRIIPQCKEIDGKQGRISFTVVIDAEETDTMEDMLAELAGKSPSEESIYTQIRKSISRFQKQKDKKGVEYYFDEVKVVSVEEFQKSIT